MKNTRDIVVTAMFTAVICVISPFTIPVGDIPLSLATFAIYICAAATGWKYGTLSVIAYIALGAVGAPVFSGFTGGFYKLAGPTGGYIVGYILMALIIGAFADLSGGRKWAYPVGMLLGAAVLYIFGTVWYIVLTGAALPAALAACVVPFLPLECVKIIAASVLAPSVRRMLRKAEQNQN